MIRLTSRSTRTDTLFPYTTLFRSVEFPCRTLPYPPQYLFSAVARKNGAGIAFVSSPFPHLHTVTRVRHLGNLTIHLQVTSKSPQRPQIGRASCRERVCQYV